MNKFKYILLSLVATMAFVSCNDDEEEYRYGDFFYNMVTYMGNEEGGAVFTYQSYNDSPLITLKANNYTSDAIKVGQRMLLNYEVAEDLGNNHQVVTVKGLSKVHTDTIRVEAQMPTMELKMDTMRVESIWRTGNYLNVRCKVLYSESGRIMYLYTDGTIDANGCLNCYQIQNLMGAKTYYWTETYMSYYIEPALTLNGVKTLIYNVNDEKKQYIFPVNINEYQ